MIRHAFRPRFLRKVWTALLPPRPLLCVSFPLLLLRSYAIFVCLVLWFAHKNMGPPANEAPKEAGTKAGRRGPPRPTPERPLRDHPRSRRPTINSGAAGDPEASPHPRRGRERSSDAERRGRGKGERGEGTREREREEPPPQRPPDKDKTRRPGTQRSGREGGPQNSPREHRR